MFYGRYSLIFPVWTILIVVLAIFIYLGIPYIYKKCLISALKSKAVTSRSLVLTFDDGPGDNLTSDIMDLLDKYDARASFFLLGKNIAGRENVVRQIAQRGHEVCSHGFDHLNYMKVFPWRSIEDIKKGWAAIDSALEKNSGIYSFRPPYGKLNIVSLIYLLLKKVNIFYWTDDSGDTWKNIPDSDRLAKLINNSHGAVTLSHDFNRRKKQTELLLLESIKLAIEKAKENNLSIVTVSQLK